MLPSDPNKIPHERGWIVLPVFENPAYGKPFLDALNEIRNDPEHPGFSDVGIRNLIFTHILNVRPDAVLEVGSHIGTATIVMALALKLNGFGELITIEPQDHFLERLSYYVKKAEVDERVKIVKGLSSDSVIRDSLRRRGPFEVIFIDANHNYEAVKEELRFCWEILSENGFMFFHDTSAIKGVSLDTEKKGGVRRAITEAKEELPGFNLIAYEYPLWLNDCGAAIACKQGLR